jgi:hypothetical protein
MFRSTAQQPRLLPGAVGCVLTVLCLASTSTAWGASPTLTKAQRARLDLSGTALTEADLEGVVAPTPSPTTLPVAPDIDPPRTLCGISTPSISLAERYETGQLNGSHATNTDPSFSFVYSDSGVAVFPTSATAKRYVNEIAKANDDCTNYFYGDKTDQRYIPRREFAAPKAGDQAVIFVASLALSSGNQRDDVVSVVRAGQLVSRARLQISGTLDQDQIEDLATGQAKSLESALKKATAATKN